MEVKERILIKAHELFVRYGFKRVTMDEIAVKTGISKKTIYHSFSNKDEIVNGVLENSINRSVSLCEQNALKAENAVHEMFLGMEVMQELLSEMNPFVFEELEKFFPSVFQKLYVHKHNYMYEKIRQNLERGIEEGLYRKEINADIITRLRIEGMFLPFNQYSFPAAKYNIAEVERESIELLLFGLCTPEGQMQIKKIKEQKIKEYVYE